MKHINYRGESWDYGEDFGRIANRTFDELIFFFNFVSFRLNL